MPNPCITDTDCIQLSLDGSGNLQADIVLDPDPDNALTCGTNGLFGDICPISTTACNGLIKGTDGGLWTHQISRDIGVISFPEVTLAVSAGPEVVVQSGTASITNTGCSPAMIFRNVAYGTSQVTALTAGGRVELSTEGSTDGGPFTQFGFAVLSNITGSPGLEHAWWPTHSPEVGFSVLAAGATQTISFRRKALVTAGSCTVNYRAAFVFSNVIAVSGIGL